MQVVFGYGRLYEGPYRFFSTQEKAVAYGEAERYYGDGVVWRILVDGDGCEHVWEE